MVEYALQTLHSMHAYMVILIQFYQLAGIVTPTSTYYILRRIKEEL